jgi:hypothetical protein
LLHRHAPALCWLSCSQTSGQSGGFADLPLWFQARKERRDAKLQLFLVLVSQRKANVTPEVVKALNSIDVVFADRRHIKELWHRYYALLAQKPGQERSHAWIELLSAMAHECGYTGVSQIDLDKFYIPQGHVDEEEFQRAVSEEWHRVLKNTERFLVEPRDSDGHEKTPVG